jgi:CHAD domain-containing protein
MPLVATEPGVSCEAAFRSIVLSCAQALDAALAVFLESDDPAGPHKARVALRRLTTALDAFSPILRRKGSAALRSQAKAFFRDLGKVRDSDVHLMKADFDTGAGPRKDLLSRNRRLRDKTRARLRKARTVAFAQILRLAVQQEDGIFRRSPAAQARREAPVSAFAEDAISQAWAVCRGYGTSVKAIPEPGRHDFRKDMKTLRYLAEFFSADLPGLQDTDFLKDFRKMQDALGVLNDFTVALEIEGRKPSDRLPPTVAAALDRAEALWSRLYPAPVPWDDQATRRP